MAVRLIPIDYRNSLDDGTFVAVDASARIKFYLAGTTTPTTVYSDRELTSSLGSYVAIDSEGYPQYKNIWGADDVSYKIGIIRAGYNDGAERYFDYVTVAESTAAAETDSTPAFLNGFVNGGFTNWTNATSFSNISGSGAVVETADEWGFAQAGAASNAISRQTADSTGARYGYRMGRPAASISTEVLRLFQALTTDEAYRYRGKTATVSFGLKKGADFSGANVAVFLASGTNEGESAGLINSGGWGGQVTVISQTQTPTTTLVRYQFSGVCAANIKELGLQISYTPAGTAGANDWIQIEDVQIQPDAAATDFEARPEPVEYLQANLSAAGRALVGAGIAAAGKYPLFSSASAVVLADAINPNRLINGGMAVNQLVSGSGVADDTYCVDGFYILTQTGTIAWSQLTDVENGAPYALRLTQSQASAQRIGVAQIIEARNCKDLRAAVTTLAGRVRLSASSDVRYAVLEWTGTADSVTSDVVADWTSTSYTAGGFFNSTTLNVLAVGEVAATAATARALDALNATVGASANNIIVMVWTESTLAQNGTLDVWNLKYEKGSVATPFVQKPFQEELRDCQRYCWKSFPQATAPAQNAGTTGAIGFGQMTGASTAQQYSYRQSFPVPMLTTPSITLYNTSAANAQARNLSRGTDCSATAVQLQGDGGFGWTTTTAGGSAAGDQLAMHALAEARL